MVALTIAPDIPIGYGPAGIEADHNNVSSAYHRHGRHGDFVRLQASRRERQDYVASGEPTDKAGAYAIQGLASKFVVRIEGSYSNVVGLPVALVYRLLKGYPEA